MSSTTYGMQIYDARAYLVYDSRSVTWNQVGMFIATAGQTIVRNYPAAGGMELVTMQLMVNDLPTNQEAYTHTVSVSGTRVIASGGNHTTVVLVMGR